LQIILIAILAHYTNRKPEVVILAQAELRQSDIHEAQAAYEDLHIHVSADSYDKVDAAVALIELLLTPVSVSSEAWSLPL
jgi:nitrogenase molybdenum-iron protein alpha/beta subunit